MLICGNPLLSSAGRYQISCVLQPAKTPTCAPPNQREGCDRRDKGDMEMTTKWLATGIRVSGLLLRCASGWLGVLLHSLTTIPASVSVSVSVSATRVCIRGSEIGGRRDARRSRPPAASVQLIRRQIDQTATKCGLPASI